ncbi:MAG: hypothetical protein J5836_02490, partial [Clostridia bacterium]|nr:hypothetical protein [Clostridia bacterium]
MGKVFRRLICFFLGAVIGVVTTFGGVATAVYYMYGNITVEDLSNGKTQELGDLNDYSLEDIVGFIMAASKSPEDYTLRDLEEKYGVNVEELLKSLLGGDFITEEKKEQGYLDDLKSISIFSLLSSDGISEFLNNVSAGAVMCFLPDDLISPEERNKLRRYTIGQLLEKDEYTGQMGLLSALRDVAFGGLFTKTFEYRDGKYVAKAGADGALNILANVKLGAIIDTFITGKSSIPEEMVEGGLASIGEMTVGEFLSELIGKSELVDRIDGLFNGMKIRELFSKDENGYSFKITNLTDNVNIGGLLGYYYDEEDGAWYKDETKTEPIKGVMKVVASFNATELYLALSSGSTTSEKIRNVILSVGDLSVGDVLETLGYELVDGYYTKGGKAIKSQFVSALANISIKDIVGEGEFTGKQIVRNFLNSISDVSDDLTIGEGVGELFGIEPDGNGGYRYIDASKGEVNFVVERLLAIEISDLIKTFNKDKIEAKEIVELLEQPLDGLKVGSLMGYQKKDGVWTDKNGKELSPALSAIAGLEFSGIFAILAEEKDPTEILKGFMPDLKIGDIVAIIFSDVTYKDGVYYKGGEPFTDGLNTVYNLHVWEAVSGIDPEGEFDLYNAVKDVLVGEVIGFHYKESVGAWCFGTKEDALKVTGAIGKIFAYTLGELLDSSSEHDAEFFIQELRKITVGDIFCSILGYAVGSNGEVTNVRGGKVNELFALFAKYGLEVGEIIDAVTGDGKLDVLDELIELFGDSFRIGDFFKSFDLAEYSKENGWTIFGKNNKAINAVLNVVVSNYLKNVKQGEGLGKFVTKEMRGLYIGDFADIIMPTKLVDGNWVDGDGKAYSKALQPVLSISLNDVMNLIDSKDMVHDGAALVFGNNTFKDY